MKQTTAKSVEQVRDWIESTPHHEGRKVPEMELRNHHEIFRIPTAIWSACSTKSGDQFDNRMFRWDFDNDSQDNT
jgi:hypothetical protein